MPRITWLSHSVIQIDTQGTTLLVDPFLTGNELAPMGPDDVEPDVILVSHGHSDHVGDTVPIAKRTGAMVISNYEIAGWLQQQGLENVHAMHIGGGAASSSPTPCTAASCPTAPTAATPAASSSPSRARTSTTPATPGCSTT